MSQTRVLPFTVTIPAGTLEATPYSQALDLDGWVIGRLDLEVPTGPNGLMGFQMWNNGVPWLPYGAGEWIVWDNVKDSWYLDGQPTAAGWAVVGYNLGAYDHAVTVRAHVTPAAAAAPDTGPPALTFVQTPVPATGAVLI